MRLGHTIVHPHQRCGYSNSPFARMHDLYTTGFRNGLEGLDNVVHRMDFTGKPKEKIAAPNFLL